MSPILHEKLISIGTVDPPEAGTFLNFNFYFPGLDMMGELCLGALRLQGMQGFWAADGMCSRGSRGWLAEEDKVRRFKKQEKGLKKGSGFFFFREAAVERGFLERQRGRGRLLLERIHAG